MEMLSVQENKLDNESDGTILRDNISLSTKPAVCQQKRKCAQLDEVAVDWCTVRLAFRCHKR